MPALMRTLAAAADPVRAHAAAEALSAMRIREAVPLILDKIEDPFFAYYNGTLAYHLGELDCRGHIDRVAGILVREGVECCMNAGSIFKHRRGPIAHDVRQRALERLDRFINEYGAGEHRVRASEYHADPEERHDTVVWARDLLLEWNERERAYPRQGENRSTGERTADWVPISGSELAGLLEGQVARLDGEDRALWDRNALYPAFLIPCERTLGGATGRVPEQIFCIARAGNEVLLYDDVEDVFATGRLDDDGVLREWYGEGEELRWVVYQLAPDDGPG